MAIRRTPAAARDHLGRTGPIGRTVGRPDGFVAWCVELLSPLGTVRAKAMFGGHGLYVDERFVAIVADEVLYLKADALTSPAFAAAGSAPFSYTAGGRTTTMSYWRAPADAMESPGAMLPWGRLALEAATRAAAGAAHASRRSRAAAVPPGTRRSRP
jgi:DNA transformation protein